MKLTKTRLKQIIREELMSESMEDLSPSWQQMQLQDVLYQVTSELTRFSDNVNESTWSKDSKLNSQIKQIKTGLGKLDKIIKKLPVGKSK